MEFSISNTGYTIKLTANFINRDLNVAITGGDVPHIGTVTTYDKEREQKEVVRFPSHDGRFHKDDVLADRLLEKIKDGLPGNCVITTGVHVDYITTEQIHASFGMVDELGEKLKSWISIQDNFEDPIYHKKG
ncbi:amino acid decarboxylase [Lactobacillus salivarius]|uniref:Amino acid decarboxylase n=1 Tax=Ligilactobacillus salivarius TaxID=1624 RepID=A0A6A8LPM3_9LACO|nr:amino acid decarboxylase [Ligilactobacillus salivarius]MSE08608.1 amino acid decarboxylase [Ligilactobacillus salivarius]